MIKRFMFLFLSILSAAPLSGKEFEVQVVNPPKSSLPPGSNYTLIFKVSNLGETDIVCNSAIGIPENWMVLAHKPKFEIKAGQVDIRLVSIYIPLYVTPGRYMPEYTIGREGKPDRNVRVPIYIDPVKKLKLKLFESPEYILAGNRIYATFNLKNEGNCTETVSLYTGNCLLEGASGITIAPGSVAVVKVFSDTDKDMGELNTRFLKLEAAVVEGDSCLAKTSAYSQVNVFPVEESQKDEFSRFPVQLSGGFLGRKTEDKTQLGFQGELSGSGFIDENKKRQLEFRLFGPNHFNLSVLGRYDEYYARYKSSDLQVIIGDHNFKATPLIEYSRYGRGIGFDYSLRSIRVGGFWHKPRFYADIKTEYNSFLRYSINSKNALQVNYFRKEMAGSGQAANLYSFSTSLELFRSLILETDFSHGTYLGKAGNGVMVKGNIKKSKVNLSFLYLLAGENYPGYYNNTSLYSGNLSYNLGKKLSLNLNYHKDAINLKQDTLMGVAPANNNFRLGINWRYSRRGTLFLYGGDSESRDQLPANLFHYKESFLRGGITQRLNHFNLSPGFAVARTNNLHTGSSGSSYNLDVDIDYVRKFGMAGLFFNWQNTSRYETDDPAQFYYGAKMTFKQKESTSFSLYFQNNYSLEEVYRNRNLFTVRIKQRITRNQHVDLACNYILLQKQENKKDFSVSARYALQLNVPVKRVAGYGGLQGTITDSEGEGVPGIRLFCDGRSEITDEQGVYKFKNLLPGKHYLLIDQTTVGISAIPDVPQPVEVTIEPGENYFSFGMTLSSKISGHIFFKDAGGQLEKLLRKDGNEKGHVVVEISDGNVVRRKLVSLNSDFVFDNLMPGTWKVLVYRNGLGEDYCVEKDIFDVILNPDKEVRIDATVVKKTKAIRFMQNKVILQEN